MSDVVTMNKIERLMTYLGIESYVIPHYNLPLPKAANESNFRPEKIFRLYKNGTMSYKGYGYGATVKDIEIFGLLPDERYLTRAYLHLGSDARKKITFRAKRGGIPNLEHLILKFNNIDFIENESISA